jgi:PAS domain S-box-containing protein
MLSSILESCTSTLGLKGKLLSLKRNLRKQREKTIQKEKNEKSDLEKKRRLYVDIMRKIIMIQFLQRLPWLDDMKIIPKMSIMFSALSLMISGVGYVSLTQLNNAAEPITADSQNLLLSTTHIIIIYVLIFTVVTICFLVLSFKPMVNLLRKSHDLRSRSQKEYRDLYENSPALYRTISTDGVIVNCNKSYAERLGYTKEEIIGTSIFKHTADNDIKAMTDSFETWKSSGEVKNREIWLKTKNGIIFPTLISANNLYDENGSLIGSNTIIKDISEIYEARKKMEKQAILELQLTELKKMEKLKDEFTSMITHELKSPLFPILGYCEMLTKHISSSNITAEQRKMIKEIHNNSNKMHRLIRDLLTAQKLEMGRMKFDKMRFDVTEFMMEIYREYLPLMEEKLVEFVNSSKENLILISDKHRIRQVIDNLVLNSVDFSPIKQGKIEINAKSKDGMVIFYVKDNGIGIPKDQQELLFHKFYQVDTSLGRKHGGNGLGLAICKGITEGLGGRIWMESTEGQGTTFYFSIP